MQVVCKHAPLQVRSLEAGKFKQENTQTFTVFSHRLFRDIFPWKKSNMQSIYVYGKTI